MAIEWIHGMLHRPNSIGIFGGNICDLQFGPGTRLLFVHRVIGIKVEGVGLETILVYCYSLVEHFNIKITHHRQNLEHKQILTLACYFQQLSKLLHQRGHIT